LVLGQPFEALGGHGGIVALHGCLWDPDAHLHPFASIFFDLSAHSAWLPIELHYDASSFSYPQIPHNYVLGPAPHYHEDWVVEEYGCTIGSQSPSRFLALTSPNGGETWYVGGTPPIRWLSSGVDEVRLEYSMDGGGTWQDIVSSTLSSGLYLWSVPNDPSSQCLVRISDATHGTPTDVSEATFTIEGGTGHVLRVPLEWETIQFGIYGAAPGDTVLVAPGIYGENLVLKGHVSVRSESGPGATVIDAGGQGNAVIFDVATQGSLLQGFTVTGGNASQPGLPSMEGGGVLFWDSSGVLRDCWVIGNHAQWAGGVACVYPRGPAVVDNCLIAGNSSDETGGGIGVDGGHLTITSSTIVGNSSGDGGSGIHVEGPGTALLERSIIASNLGVGAGGNAPALTCCCVYGNAGGPGSVAGQIGMNGNFAEDPLFCDGPGGNYRLDCLSPCVTGYGCGLIGALGVGCGASRVERETWGGVKRQFK
jgi:hypothetical protein